MMRRKATLDDDLQALPGQRPLDTSVDPATGEPRVKPRGAWKFALLAFVAMVVVLALKNKFPQPTLFTKAPLIEAAATAQKSGKLLVVDFYGTWCPPCERMDKETWCDKQVERWVTDHAIAVRLNTSSPNEKDRAAAEAFAVREVPTVVLVRDGKEVGRKVGFIDGPALAEWFESRRTAPDEPVRSAAGQ